MLWREKNMTNKTETETKEEIVVGIDCALEKHQYHISTKDGTVLSKGPVRNARRDAKRLVKKLGSITQKKRMSLSGWRPQTIIISA